MLSPILIPKIDPISQKEFAKNYLRANRPIVIKGLLNDWPALKLWTPEYFINKFGDTEASVVKVREGINTYEGKELDAIKVSRSMPKIQAGGTSDNVVIASCVDLFPSAIREDYATPAYCAKGKFLTSHIFLSPEGTVTPIHQDLPENLYTMVRGTKRVHLFAPGAPVYPNSRFSRIPHYARIDVENPDYNLYPRFRKAQPYTVDLAAGETLFIPSFWWHHIRNLEPTIALNFWWSQGWKLPIAAARDLYKMIRSL